ncbi:hypothetical protein [Candidatus Bathycorpusculum sp.]|uniref:hypothetical protein n=1 Tax=Candidatus Bathycorpusculum sp. TaxID=2994959 RepID=UPI0028387960|nr:hypothetical protein [Candidatus Termitimicrobium sp.]
MYNPRKVFRVCCECGNEFVDDYGSRPKKMCRFCLQTRMELNKARYVVAQRQRRQRKRQERYGY